MSVERRKVLEMLKDGKITPDEAEKLLDRLGSTLSNAVQATPVNGTEVEVAPAAGAHDGAGEGQSKPLRYLRIIVDSPKRDNVNVRVPLGLIRTGLKLSTLMPKRVNQRLSERGIDLSHLGDLNGEALNAALAELNIDVESGNGDKVHICCE